MNTIFHKTLVLFTFISSIFIISAQENFRVVGNLPESISETSGLIHFNNALITHKDSGNESVLYELDTLSLTIQRSVTIANIENVDWEALAQDEDYIYIGDFGNNVGGRRDLSIHIVSKSEYLSADVITATTINFSYEDQIDFTNSGDSDWDAEAFFVLNEELIVLTKQWKSLGSVAYSMPKVPGTYIASRVDSYENIGLVTDSTFNPTTNTLIILGYSSFLSPFIGIIEDLNSEAVFEGVELSNLDLNFVQTEGITYTTDGIYYVSSEQFSRTSPSINSPSQLFSFKVNTFVEPEIPVESGELENPEIPSPEEVEDQLIVYQDSNDGLFRYEVKTDKAIFGQVVFDIVGRKIWESNIEIEKVGVLNFPLENVLYYFVTYTEDGLLAKAFVPRKY